MMSAQPSDYSSDAARTPLRKWIKDETKKAISTRRQNIDSEEKKRIAQEFILRKTSIAYAIAEILRRSRAHHCATPTPMSISELCSIDNFVVRINGKAKETKAAQFPKLAWNDIEGVDMLSPQLSSDIVEPSFLRSDIFYASDGEESHMGRYLEVEFPSLRDDVMPAAGSQSEENASCHPFGALLYELFSHISPFPVEGSSQIKFSANNDNPESKFKNFCTSQNENKTTVPEMPISPQVVEESQEMAHSALETTQYVPLKDLGLPSSICLLVQNLLECGECNRPDDAYDSLDTVSKDLHLLLLDPSRFLFKNEQAPDNGSMQLSLRENKLYGREHEESLITDAFCRVSSGKSEALFIGGFSGSGKSMLVNSLKARVDMVEGYVVTHKFDKLTRESFLLEVIAVFDDLCLVIQERSSRQDLLAIVKVLTEIFDTDLSMLAQLLPNIVAISPQLKQSDDTRKSGDQMGLRSVCFTLQRFMGVVSSKAHPVMLFLDDLHWCDSSALTLIESILSDCCGSSCLFFVGSYRNNEVHDDGHAVFSLMDSLRLSGVPTSTLTLEGLDPQDLNTMISDTMCTFPRICKPLSDIVFQKTKGNPFFVQEFLRSLVDGGLLQYSARKRRWVWDEDRIRSMDITGNVLHLLSTKMKNMSESTQLTLKVAACFGTKIKESVVEYLSSNSEYSNIRDELDQAVSEGFMIKLGSTGYKFVHDEVREAAYGLIKDSEKNQYHNSLGMTLYSTTKGSDVDDVIFCLVNQINQGIDISSASSPEIRIDLAELNEKAGAKSINCSDYLSARSYLNVALSLLPTDHWKSHYDLSLRLTFLLAKSAYSCGDMKKAQDILKDIQEECRCLEDKLSAYVLLVTILNDCGDGLDAYNTCHEVLSQLGEIIPNSSGLKQTTKMIDATSKCVKTIDGADLLEMKEMDDKFSTILKFYSLMATVAFFTKPEMFVFLACRLVQLTMKHGICMYSITGFVQYAAVLCGNKMRKDIQGASRIGKAAMTCWKKRFYSAEQLPEIHFAYYGLVAFHNDPLQSCSDMIQQGFDAGMSIGESGAAFLNSIQHIKTLLLAGENLLTLLKKVDYYLELTCQFKNELAKTYLLIFRDTISTLIDRGELTSSKSNFNANENVSKYAHSFETINFHRAIQAYWLGHSERCHHYAGKMLQNNHMIGILSNIVMMFIHGLNTFQVLKRQNTIRFRAIPHNAIAALKTISLHSQWNFRNKVHLLEAEDYSFQGDHEEAKTSYAAAITSARCSRFIHEQGLACELAGCHYQKLGDHKSSLSFFNQARQCYAEWGSQMKVDGINRRIETLPIPLAGDGNMGIPT